MSESARIAAAADIIAEARRAGAPLDVLPEAIRPRDVAEAYTIQSAVHDRFAAAPEGHRVGYKIGCTTEVMQTYLGIPSPCAGGVFAGGVHASGAVLPHGSFRRVGIECEIAVRLARDLVPGEAPFAAADVGPAIESFMAAIEIVDDRYVDWRKTDTPTLDRRRFLRRRRRPRHAGAGRASGRPGSLHRHRRGSMARRSAGAGGATSWGTPLNALAWLANSLAERGMMLKSGEIVLLGSLVETKWLAAGDHVRIAVAELGPVELTVT